MRPPVELGVHRARSTALRAFRVPCQEQENPCAPDRPSKILLAQVGTLSSSPIPRFGSLFSFFLSFRDSLQPDTLCSPSIRLFFFSECAPVHAPVVVPEREIFSNTKQL